MRNTPNDVKRQLVAVEMVDARPYRRASSSYQHVGSGAHGDRRTLRRQPGWRTVQSGFGRVSYQGLSITAARLSLSRLRKPKPGRSNDGGPTRFR